MNGVVVLFVDGCNGCFCLIHYTMDMVNFR